MFLFLVGVVGWGASTVTTQMTLNHEKQLEEVKTHFESELSRVVAQHAQLVEELEKRIQAERTRYRELQERTHLQVQTIEAQMEALQKSYDDRVFRDEGSFIQDASNSAHLNETSLMEHSRIQEAPDQQDHVDPRRRHVEPEPPIPVQWAAGTETSFEEGRSFDSGTASEFVAAVDLMM